MEVSTEMPLALQRLVTDVRPLFVARLLEPDTEFEVSQFLARSGRCGEVEQRWIGDRLGHIEEWAKWRPNERYEFCTYVDNRPTYEEWWFGVGFKTREFQTLLGQCDIGLSPWFVTAFGESQFGPSWLGACMHLVRRCPQLFDFRFECRTSGLRGINPWLRGTSIELAQLPEGETAWRSRDTMRSDHAEANRLVEEGKRLFDVGFRACIANASQLSIQTIDAMAHVWRDRNETGTLRPAASVGPFAYAVEQTTNSALQSPQKSPKSKRGAGRGGRDSDSKTKLVAALSKHHKYSSRDGGLNTTPVKVRELAEKANTVPSTASAFFKREFEGYKAYVRRCNDEAGLSAALKLLNGDFTPAILAKAATKLKDVPQAVQDDDE